MFGRNLPLPLYFAPIIRNKNMKRHIAGLLAILCLVALGGCGNSGDLYLPKDTAETFTADSQFRDN